MSAVKEGIKTFENLMPNDVPKSVGSFTLEFRDGKWVTVSSSGDVFTARGRYIFITEDGKITVSRASPILGGRPSPGHIDISGGRPVSYAGEVDFTQKGAIRSWDNNSGHYKPGADAGSQAGLPMEKFQPFEPSK